MENKKREIVMVPYQADWPEKFQAEAAALYPVFWMCWRAVYHIGSTAVPGLASKPTLDILLSVHDITKVDTLDEAVADLGYTPKGEYGIPGRRYYHQGDQVHFFHLHVFGYTSTEIERHILFRDFLRSHPEETRAYESLKMKLAEIHRYDPNAYTDGKDEFIREMDARALQWKQKTGWRLPAPDWIPEAM